MFWYKTGVGPSSLCSTPARCQQSSSPCQNALSAFGEMLFLSAPPTGPRHGPQRAGSDAGVAQLTPWVSELASILRPKAPSLGKTALWCVLSLEARAGPLDLRSQSPSKMDGVGSASLPPSPTLWATPRLSSQWAMSLRGQVHVWVPTASSEMARGGWEAYQTKPKYQGTC